MDTVTVCWSYINHPALQKTLKHPCKWLSDVFLPKFSTLIGIWIYFKTLKSLFRLLRGCILFFSMILVYWKTKLRRLKKKKHGNSTALIKILKSAISTDTYIVKFELQMIFQVLVLLEFDLSVIHHRCFNYQVSRSRLIWVFLKY